MINIQIIIIERYIWIIPDYFNMIKQRLITDMNEEKIKSEAEKK